MWLTAPLQNTTGFVAVAPVTTLPTFTFQPTLTQCHGITINVAAVTSNWIHSIFYFYNFVKPNNSEKLHDVICTSLYATACGQSDLLLIKPACQASSIVWRVSSSSLCPASTLLMRLGSTTDRLTLHLWQLTSISQSFCYVCLSSINKRLTKYRQQFVVRV